MLWPGRSSRPLLHGSDDPPIAVTDANGVMVNRTFEYLGRLLTRQLVGAVVSKRPMLRASLPPPPLPDGRGSAGCAQRCRLDPARLELKVPEFLPRGPE